MSTMKQWKVIVILLAIWLCIVLYMTTSVPSGQDAASRTERSLARALDELDKLQRQNKKLQELMNQLQNNQGLKYDSPDTAVENLEKRLHKANVQLSEIANYSSNGLSYEEEHARRKAENTVRELWYFLDSQLKSLENGDAKHTDQVSKLRKDLEGYRRTLLDDFNKLRTANKAEDWRLQRSKELHDLVQRRLIYLENPDNCRTAKKVTCNLHKGCGFGCQLHHVTYCLIAAYAMKRTLILQSKGWRYSPKGWETFFEPLSQKCSEDDIKGSVTHWRSSQTEMDKYDIIEMPIVDNLHPRPDFMPLSVPADLAPEIAVFHGDPAVWWIGQIVNYLFRLQPNVLTDVVDAGKKMGFRNTIVGVHVRRTDKINLEAAFHPLEEYMEHVKEFYDQLERTTHIGIPRRVYLATDDANLLPEAKQKYPNYKFISDITISQSAGIGTRYTDSSLRGVIIDIYFLSRCDFLVCTFSSQVCRVAYELMQTLHGDASRNFRSLDDVFYYGGQNEHDLIVVEAHQGNSEGLLDIQVGDAIGIAGNHWNGYSKGMNKRTGLSGLFPSYKVEDAVVPVEMPTYSEVPRKQS